MAYFLEIAQTIVSAFGGVYETILVMLFVAMWMVYRTWNRRPNPPRGVYRMGIWLPMCFCVYTICYYISETRFQLELLSQAGALNDPQQELQIQIAVRGILQLLAMGIVGSVCLWWLTRLPKSNVVTGSTDSNVLAGAREKEDAEPVHLVKPSMGHGNT